MGCHASAKAASVSQYYVTYTVTVLAIAMTSSGVNISCSLMAAGELFVYYSEHNVHLIWLGNGYR